MCRTLFLVSVYMLCIGHHGVRGLYLIILSEWRHWILVIKCSLWCSGEFLHVWSYFFMSKRHFFTMFITIRATVKAGVNEVQCFVFRVCARPVDSCLDLAMFAEKLQVAVFLLGLLARSERLRGCLQWCRHFHDCEFEGYTTFEIRRKCNLFDDLFVSYLLTL